MKIAHLAKIPVFLLSFLAVLFILFLSPASAQTQPGADIVVRIAKIEQALDVIDEIFEPVDRQSKMPPSAQLRAMLMGTDWIDPDRAVVIGLNFYEDQMEKEPDMAVLVPFIQPNEDFATVHGAIKKSDHYLIPMQKETPAHLDPELASVLAEEAKNPGKRFVTMDIAVPRVLDKADSQIQQLLALLKEEAAKAQQEGPEAVPPEQLDIIADTFLKVARQVETLSLGVDLNRSNAAFSLKILALADSEMAEALTGIAHAPEGRLGNFEPDSELQIQFRSRPYDTAAASGLMVDYFGEFYKSMGIDIEQLARMFSGFSGEMAGAMSIGPGDMQMQMEVVSSLAKEDKPSADFLESEYIPQLLSMGKQMAQFYKDQQPGLELDSVFKRTENTEINGNTVVGMEMRMPIINPEAEEVSFLQMPLRITTVNNYLLTASDDMRMKSLIQNVSELTPADTDGPLMTVTMDLAGLIKAAAAMNPQQQDIEMPGYLSDMGRLVYTVELQERGMQAEYSMKIEDIRRLVEAMQSIENQTGPEASVKPSFPSQGKKMSSGTVVGVPVKNRPESNATVSSGGQLEDDPQYWMDKGGLYAAYGNEDAAIESYKKALELDPENSRAAFNLGLAYADKGNYDKALDFINKALSAETENGNYLYGRGWVYLQENRHEKAMEDISKAAELGNPDAIRYMDSIAPRQKQSKPD
ncbi:MAG: tetratricopeptide repeat protein [Desulfobacteraceae bacterium]|nr:tetratricopeptide repeat protein [Desulfobacteraceae bacterium]